MFIKMYACFYLEQLFEIVYQSFSNIILSTSKKIFHKQIFFCNEIWGIVYPKAWRNCLICSEMEKNGEGSRSSIRLQWRSFCFKTDLRSNISNFCKNFKHFCSYVYYWVYQGFRLNFGNCSKMNVFRSFLTTYDSSNNFGAARSLYTWN